jgi:hypothetical protein
MIDEAEEIIDQEKDVWLSEPQTDVLMARTALILDMAGQGGGKTENIGFKSGHFITQFTEARGFIAANTHMQLNQSTLNKVFKVWKDFFNLTEYNPKTNPGGDYVMDKIPPDHFERFDNFKNWYGMICFKNGGLIYTGSLENFKAHDGKEFAWAELDETKDTKKEALTTVILARLRQYGLWALPDGSDHWDNKINKDDAVAQGWKSWNPCTIHTSPAEGGVDWIIEMFDLGSYEPDIRKALADPYSYYYRQDEERTVVIYQADWNEANLPPGFIKSRRAQLSENEQLKFIDGYPFSKTGSEWFPHFSRQKHVRPVEHQIGSATHLTYDFNVMPYVTQEAADVEYVSKWWHPIELRKSDEWEMGMEPLEVMQIRFFKEYCMKPPSNSTEHAAQAFKDDVEPETYPDVFIYGDASGKNRITGLGSLTQYRIITGILEPFLPNNWDRVPKANVAVNKRRDLLNRIFEGKIPEVEIIIDPGCTELIRDCEYVKQDAKGKFKEQE